MGKTYQGDKVLRSGLWPRSVFCLAIVVGLSCALPLYTAAEPETGLVISKDGGNVNVSLDSEASANVSIRRNEDTMIIRLPKSFNPKLIIDSSLQKDSVVQETESAEGRTITIHSQQIYLMTREHLEAPPTPTAKARTANADKSSKTVNKAKSAESASSDGMQEAVNTLAVQEEPHPVSLNGQTGKSAAAEKPAVLTGNTSAQKSEQALKEAIENLKRETNEAAENAKPEGSAEKQTPANAEVNPVQKTAPNQSPEANINAIPADPESQPLNMDNNAHSKAVHTSTGSLLRIAVSLLLVLGLFVAFVRLLLPRLMERYPDFFENLKRQAEQRANQKAERNALNHGLGKESWPLKAEPRRENRFFAPAKAEPAGKVEPASKKGYLERMNVGGDHFNVLTSTALGKGKELHLVEIRGRQFMVATTPYTVTLLKDLTDESGDVETAEPSITGLMDESLRTGESSFAGERPARPETVAYLSDHASIQQPKANPYASAPPSKLPKGQPQVQKPTTPDQVYLKYLNQSAPPPTMMAGQGYAAPGVPTSSQPPYVDAEEVVVLEDYDDTYGY